MYDLFVGNIGIIYVMVRYIIYFFILVFMLIIESIGIVIVWIRLGNYIYKLVYVNVVLLID